MTDHSDNPDTARMDDKRTPSLTLSSSTSPSSRRLQRRDVWPLLIVVCGLALVFFIARWTEAHLPVADTFTTEDEELYVSPETARRMSLGFNGLIADWYWLRSLQYVGHKMTSHQEKIQLDDLHALNARQLAPLLDHATTLDPQFTAAYEYGAVVLPAIDAEAALRLTEKGIRANPQNWRLYQHLGFIYWQQSRFREASKAYGAGAKQPSAPFWMNAMAAQMEARGGSRDTARDIYLHMSAEGDDEQIKLLAKKRLLQLDSLDERDAIRRVLIEYKTSNSRCPAAWREVAPALRAARLKLDASGAPLDPTGLPYVLDASACDVTLDARTQIPQQ